MAKMTSHNKELLRRQYAGQAMQGIMNNTTISLAHLLTMVEVVTDVSVLLADTLIEKLEKDNNNG